jgi:hypothetical protein
MKTASASWLETPLADFIRDARLRLALLLQPSGRVLAQSGFARSIDVSEACSLAAAIHASAEQLGRELGDEHFGPLHHAGQTRQLFLAPIASRAGTILVLAVFDDASSLGIVRHFFSTFVSHVTDAAPPGDPEQVGGEDLEKELGRSLAVLFGRA